MLFRERLRICLPEDFSLVNEEEAAEIYPSAERPQVIFSNEVFSRFLTFSLLNKPLGVEETLNAAKEFRKIIWSIYPSSLLSQAISMRFSDLRCSGFSFRIGTMEKPIFNTMFAVSFEDSLLLGTFGCGMADEEGKTLLRKLIEEAEYIGNEK